MNIFNRLFFRGKTARSAQPPSLPQGLCVYAVGDIHGEHLLLDRLMDRLHGDIRARRNDGEQVVVVFVGDYVDRGPDSRGVLDRLIALPGLLPRECRCHFLRGNHEDAMQAFLKNPEDGGDWLAFGGTETLASYGIAALPNGNSKSRLRLLGAELAKVLPREHRDFLDGLEMWVSYGDYAFVHAGVRPNVPLERQRSQDLMWIREPFLSSRTRHSHTIVHGHTVTEDVAFHPVADNPHRIGIDTGAYASGVLSAIRLRGDERMVIDTVG